MRRVVGGDEEVSLLNIPLIAGIRLHLLATNKVCLSGRSFRFVKTSLSSPKKLLHSGTLVSVGFITQESNC